MLTRSGPAVAGAGNGMRQRRHAPHPVPRADDRGDPRGPPRVPPYGMAGGLPGDVGRNWVERADGSRTELGFADETEVGAGDVFVIETPGGGGFGKC